MALIDYNQLGTEIDNWYKQNPSGTISGDQLVDMPSLAGTQAAPDTSSGDGTGIQPLFDVKTGAPSLSYDQFKTQYGGDTAVGPSQSAIDAVSTGVVKALNDLPDFSNAINATNQSLNVANQGLADLNANRFDPTAYREATRGRISRGARDIAQTALSSMANKGQVNSSIGADFISGKVNNYIADAFAQLEDSIAKIDQQDKANRTNMYGMLGQTYGNAAKNFENIDNSMVNNRNQTMATATNTLAGMQNLATAQQGNEREWLNSYQSALNSSAARGINAGTFQANYTAPDITANDGMSADGSTITYQGQTYTVGTDNQLYQGGQPQGIYKNGDSLVDAAGNVFGVIGPDGKFIPQSSNNITYNGKIYNLGDGGQFYYQGNPTGYYKNGDNVIYNGQVVGTINADGTVTEQLPDLNTLKLGDQTYTVGLDNKIYAGDSLTQFTKNGNNILLNGEIYGTIGADGNVIPLPASSIARNHVEKLTSSGYDTRDFANSLIATLGADTVRQLTADQLGEYWTYYNQQNQSPSSSTTTSSTPSATTTKYSNDEMNWGKAALDTWNKDQDKHKWVNHGDYWYYSGTDAKGKKFMKRAKADGTQYDVFYITSDDPGKVGRAISTLWDDLYK